MNTTFFQKASENKRSISWGDIFSDVWKKHRKDQRTGTEYRIVKKEKWIL